MVHFTTRHGVVQGVRGVDLGLRHGETLGIVGESGSGKSVTVQSVMGLINVPGEIVEGDIRWKGHSLLGPGGRACLKKVRGKEIAMIFQDPMTSLDPLFSIGTQITEVLRHHMGMGKEAGPAAAPSNCSRWSTSAPRKGDWISFRTRCPAACARG